jgi:hypothetical protein
MGFFSRKVCGTKHRVAVATAASISDNNLETTVVFHQLEHCRHFDKSAAAIHHNASPVATSHALVAVIVALFVRLSHFSVMQ